MYGFIYNTLRSLVVNDHGEEVWKDLCVSVGAEEIIDGILDHHYYDENMVHRLVKAASEKLGVSNEAVLKSFGHFFFKTCKNTGHSSMLRTLGHDLHGFLMNLDSLHDHLAFTYTQMAAPSFRCEKTPMGLTLHYHSQRTGLDSIVCGIVQEVAKDFYGLDVTVTRTSYEENMTSLPHHYVFSIKPTENTDENLERLIGEVNALHTGQQHSAPLTPLADDVEMTFQQSPLLLSNYAVPSDGEDGQQQILECPMAVANRSHSTGQMITVDQQLQLLGENPDHALTQDSIVSPKSPVPDTEVTNVLRVQLRNHHPNKMLPTSILPALPGASRIASRRGSTVPGEFINWPITPHIFATCFPFHIIFDFNLTIRYMGISLSRLLPKAICSEAKLTDYFDLSRPSVPLTYRNIRESIHNIFILCTKQDKINANPKTDENGEEIKDALQFRGQMIPTSSKDANCHILFLASPRISTIEELEHQGLYLSDIPIHDVTRDLLLLNRHFRVEMNIATELEKTKKELQEQKSEVEKEKKRADDLLHAMLPRSVADELITGREPRAKDYSMVTILFSDIKGFTTICNQCQPMQVVGMLNNLYTLFDALLEKNHVYKVETIGDAYMVAAGLLDTSTLHAQAVTNQAFGMREEADKVMEPVNGKSIQIRIGIHSGPVVAGVVGKKMPRFCLFGDTVNTASRMESHGEPGYVHISEATYNELKGSPYVFYSRGKINVKGLGNRQTYFVEPPGSSIKPDLEIANNDSDESVPVINIDEVQSTATKKEDVSRSPSFVTYNKCTMVSTPSVQFIHTSPSNPTFELNDDLNQARPDRVSNNEGLVMCRPSISASVENSPMPTPRSSSIDSPESQIKKNKVAPHTKTISKTELRPPSTIEEVSESSGRTSRNSNNNYGSVIDAFISKNETAVNGGTSVDTTVPLTTANKEESMRENSTTPEQSDSGDSTGSENSSKRAKRGKCVIS